MLHDRLSRSWSTIASTVRLQALPLRLLERVVPWLACEVGAAELASIMQPCQPHAEGSSQAGSADALLAQLAAAWAQRADGRARCCRQLGGSSDEQAPDMHEAFPTVTCAPQVRCA